MAYINAQNFIIVRDIHKFPSLLYAFYKILNFFPEIEFNR